MCSPCFLDVLLSFCSIYNGWNLSGEVILHHSSSFSIINIMVTVTLIQYLKKIFLRCKRTNKNPQNESVKWYDTLSHTTWKCRHHIVCNQLKGKSYTQYYPKSLFSLIAVQQKVGEQNNFRVSPIIILDLNQLHHKGIQVCIVSPPHYTCQVTPSKFTHSAWKSLF